MKLVALQNTWLKKEPVQSSELWDHEKVSKEKSTNILVKQMLEKKDGHSQVELDHGAGNWWIYDEHWTAAIKSIAENMLEFPSGNLKFAHRVDTAL